MDRRHFDREPTNLHVYARAPRHEARRLRARDISSDGVFLEGRVPSLPRGAELSIIFVIESGSTTRLLHRRARVARVTEDGMGLMHTAPASGGARPRGPCAPWPPSRWPGLD